VRRAGPSLGIAIACPVVFGRRLLVLLLVLAAIGVPAGVLRAACAGKSCPADVAQARVPFCPLPAELKAKLAAGYREGRSPDVIAVTGNHAVASPTGAGPWPSVAEASTVTAVPIAFFGRGIEPGALVPRGTGLDAIAPTLSEVLGFRRAHPEVRAGAAVAGISDGERPRLVLEMAWKGVGTQELRGNPRSWSSLRSLMERGTATLAADTGSLPLDPAATLTTIGSGGLPSQHGITGALVRGADGRVMGAWGPGAPLSVIATLPDDLDQVMDQRPLIGLIASDESDRGIVGGEWYVGHDRDAMVMATGGSAVPAAERLLAEGFGRDDVPDILAVVLDGSVGSMDKRTHELVAAAERAAGGSVAVVIAGTGSDSGADTRSTDGALVRFSDVVSEIDAGVPGHPNVIEDVVSGGLFLDQGALAEEGISGDAVVQATIGVTAPDGTRVFADAFQGFAVSFGRYC
jgi:hypothetical protein